ncbi:MAG: hypothetical protein M0036_10275 [Desulfobacteraceae bacterium]|nr:hypothetical protein [Desulfobacteraceae bacterium]
MLQVTGVIKNLDRALLQVKAARVDALKAEDTAVRVEGFRLMRVLRAEIRKGAPGGRQFAPLSMIRRTLGAGGRLRGNNPLQRLSRAIGYEVAARSPAALKIGFVGRASSDAWRRIAAAQQAGFETSADEPYFRRRNISIREYLAGQGGLVDRTMFGGRKSRRRNVFFLRKSTQRLKTPARPIIEPFWQAHEPEARRNIRSNFIRKLRGERI